MDMPYASLVYCGKSMEVKAVEMAIKIDLISPADLANGKKR